LLVRRPSVAQGVRRGRGGLRVRDRAFRPHRRRQERPLASHQGRVGVVQASAAARRGRGVV